MRENDEAEPDPNDPWLPNEAQQAEADIDAKLAALEKRLEKRIDAWKCRILDKVSEFLEYHLERLYASHKMR